MRAAWVTSAPKLAPTKTALTNRSRTTGTHTGKGAIFGCMRKCGAFSGVDKLSERHSYGFRTRGNGGVNGLRDQGKQGRNKAGDIRTEKLEEELR